MAQIKVTRRELYEQVWSQPMMRLAKTYGLSDVGLAKLCKKHDIPRPLRGYWAKIEARQNPKKFPLPRQNDDYEITVTVSTANHDLNPELAEQVETCAKAEKQDEARIEVAKSLRGAHHLVSLARQQLEEAKRDESGLLYTSEQTSLNVSVSKALLRRSLLIMDALLKGLQRHDYPISAGPTVTIFEQKIHFGIREYLTSIKEQPEEHDLEGPYQFGHSKFRNRYVPSGKLMLFIDERGDHCRRSWRDGEKQRLENCLNQFVAGLIEVAAYQRGREIEHKKKRLEEEETQRRLKEESQQRAERREMQAQERARVEELLQQVGNWRKSQELRSFIEATCSARIAKGETREVGSELEQWLAWANRHADRLDPFSDTLPSILDEVIPNEPELRRGFW